MADPTMEQLARAQAERTRRIKVLEACNCDWPISHLRNRYGHRATCTAMPIVMQQMADGDRDRQGRTRNV